MEDINKRLADIKTAMVEEAKAENYDLFLVLVTNVLTSNSEMIVVGEPKAIVETAFANKLNDDDVMSLPGVVSRKKQVVPPLTEQLEAEK